MNQMNRYNVFKDGIHNNVEEIQITEYIEITDEIKKQHENFKNHEEIYVQVNVEKGDETEHLIELFQERKAGKDGRIKEGSRISFLEANNFPDGCYYTIKKDSRRIDCYICELKHTPGHKLQTIARQFYVAYMHCKTIFAAVKLDEQYEIHYHFKVYGFNEFYETFEHQPIVNGNVKTPPGVRPAASHELRAYERYKKGKIHFSYTKDYRVEPFIFNVAYNQLEFSSDTIEDGLVHLIYNSRV